MRVKAVEAKPNARSANPLYLGTGLVRRLEMITSQRALTLQDAVDALETIRRLHELACDSLAILRDTDPQRMTLPAAQPPLSLRLSE